MIALEEFHRVQLKCMNYTDEVMGLDPIGSSDIRHDFNVFVRNLVQSGSYVDVENAWVLFNNEVLKPIYRLDLPAQRVA